VSVRRQVGSELIVGHVCGCCSQQLYGLFTLAYLSHDSGVRIRFTWQIPRSGFTPTLQRRMLTRDLFAVANPRCENFQKTFIKRSASEIAETATLVYRSITVCMLANVNVARATRWSSPDGHCLSAFVGIHHQTQSITCWYSRVHACNMAKQR